MTSASTATADHSGNGDAASSSPVLSGYTGIPGRSDELRAPDGVIRSRWKPVAAELDALGPVGLLARRAELDRLRAALREILTHAIRLGGSSVSDYVDADGVRGFFQLEHCVYLRTGQPCRQCGTPIRRILVAGRGTHYCPQCQH